MSGQDPGPVTRAADDIAAYAGTFTTAQQLDAIQCLLGHAKGEEFVFYVAAALNISRAHEHTAESCGELLGYALDRLEQAGRELGAG